MIGCPLKDGSEGYGIDAKWLELLFSFAGGESVDCNTTRPTYKFLSEVVASLCHATFAN